MKKKAHILRLKSKVQRIGIMMSVIILTFGGIFLYRKLNVISFAYKAEVLNISTSEQGKLDKVRLDLISDIKNSRNTFETKSNMYVLLTRYFTNGGDIYEVYDYIHNNQELNFLNEAGKIYPSVFKLIENRELGSSYSDEGMYAYLAYLEISQSHDYGDIATTGALMHQYIKMAYYKKMIVDDKSKGLSVNYPNYTKKEIESDIQKSKQFIEVTNKSIPTILQNKMSLDKTIPYDVLTGLVHYGSAVRYFEAMNLKSDSLYKSGDIFSFATTYSHNNLHDMYLFTSLSNASTLLLVSSSTTFELRNAVYPFLDIKDPLQKSGIVNKILNSRYQNPGSRFADLDIFSKNNIVKLGKKVIEFKIWLISNGWTENDFK